VLGILLARAISGRVSIAMLLAVSFPLGAGTLTFVLFLLSWGGVRLTLISAAAAYVTLAVLSLARQRFGPPSSDLPSVQREDSPRTETLHVGVLCLVALVILAAFTLAVGQSYSAWDAIAIWSVKGYGIAKEGTIFAAQEWGAHGLAYPLNVPILVALFRMIDGDVLPGSKLIFPAFYASLIAGCYWFWRRRGLDGTVAAAGALFTASLPAVFEYGTNGYANHPFSCYLVLGTLVQIDALLTKRPRDLVLSGALFGLACWTRPEGIFMVPIVAFAVALSFGVLPRQRLRLVARWLLPVVGFAAVWILFSRAFPTQGQMAQAVSALKESLIDRRFSLVPFYWIGRYGVRQAVTLSSWGLLAPVLASVAVLRLTRPRRRLLPSEGLVLAAALAACLSMTGFYYLVSLTGDVTYWLGTGVDRMFQAVGILIAVLVVLIAGKPIDKSGTLFEGDQTGTIPDQGSPIGNSPLQ
jgi:hypothetical protein